MAGSVVMGRKRSAVKKIGEAYPYLDLNEEIDFFTNNH
jgi:hypothetical protein